MSSELFTPGSQLGPYQIEVLIGRGGMGAVYRAHDPTLRRPVALKVLHLDCTQEPRVVEHFEREAEIWGRLDHPSVAPVYFAGVDRGRAFLAMKYFPAGSLAARLKSGPLAFEEALARLSEIAGALDHAHARGIVHRDVKPANVLIGDDGRAYLSDFGIARVLNEATFDSSITGTPGYMAPEQVRSVQPDPRGDLYSLGCLAYEMLTGRPPFEGDTPEELVMSQLHEVPTPPRSVAPDLPQHVEAALLRALSKEPRERWPSATLFVQGLMGHIAAGGLETVSLKSDALASAEARHLKGRGQALRLGLLAVLVALIPVAAWFSSREPLAGSIGVERPATVANAATEPAADALAQAIQRALDSGAYPEAVSMADLAVRLYPQRADLAGLPKRVREAWQAEKELGLWSP